MTINVQANSGKAALDTATPAQLPDIFRAIGLGHILRALPTMRRAVVPSLAGVYPYAPVAAECIALPDDAKAAVVLTAYARAGTATAGGLTVIASPNTVVLANMNPATLNVLVGPTGDLLFHGADAWTSVDVLYIPAVYDVYEATITVVASTGIGLLPTGNGEVLFMLEAEALVGTTIGKKIVDPPLATAPATAHAGLDLAKLNAQFAVADAVTSARVKYAAASLIDVDAFLTATSNIYL
jgi:hypothetical protein